MNDIIFRLVESLVCITAMIVARYVVPWIKAQMSANELRTIQQIVDVAVLAAQQIHWKESGAERKKHAITYVHDFCATHGISISDEQIDALIEAAVKNMRIAEGST